MMMSYLPKVREQIFSSVFRNIKRDGMIVTKETINEHFKNKKPSIGRGRFIKKLRAMYLLRNGNIFCNIFVYKKR